MKSLGITILAALMLLFGAGCRARTAPEMIPADYVILGAVEGRYNLESSETPWSRLLLTVEATGSGLPVQTVYEIHLEGSTRVYSKDGIARDVADLNLSEGSRAGYEYLESPYPSAVVAADVEGFGLVAREIRPSGLGFAPTSLPARPKVPSMVVSGPGTSSMATGFLVGATGAWPSAEDSPAPHGEYEFVSGPQRSPEGVWYWEKIVVAGLEQALGVVAPSGAPMDVNALTAAITAVSHAAAGRVMEVVVTLDDGILWATEARLLDQVDASDEPFFHE